MYAVKKSLAVLLALVLCVGMLAIPAYAAQTSQDGLVVSLTTDKDVYEQGQTIAATLTVTNTGSADVVNVSLENTIPEGYAPAEGDETALQVDKLAAGETVTLTVRFVPEAADGETEAPTEGAGGKPGTGNKPSQGGSPDTGDDFALGLWVMLLAAAVIGLTVLAIKSKQWKRMMALALCMAMTASMFAGIPMQVHAAEPEEKTIRIADTVRVGGEQLELKALVTYQLAENPTEPKPVVERPVVALEPGDTLAYDEQNDEYVLTGLMDVLSGTMTNSADVTAAAVELRFNDCVVATYAFEAGETWSIAHFGAMPGTNILHFLLTDINGDVWEQEITLVCTGEENMDAVTGDPTADADADTLPDYIEELFGTDPDSADTDEDGLPDDAEGGILGCDGRYEDSDGDGIPDGEEDPDGDQLTNLEEIALGTDPCRFDSDGDSLTDSEEVQTWNTDPAKADTDGDGMDDGWEVANGTDPLVFDEVVEITQSAQMGECTAEVTVDLPGGLVQTLLVTASEEALLQGLIPGQLSAPVSLTTGGALTESGATLRFRVPDTYPQEVTAEFVPVVYYYNEDTQLLEEVSTTYTDGVAEAHLDHFSNYVLLNKVDFDKVWEAEIRIPGDPSSGMTGLDVVLVIDSSGSMTSNDRYGVRIAAAKEFVAKLGENDRAAVVDFDSSAKLLQGFTADHELLNDAIDQVNSSGNTNLSKGMDMAISQFTAADYTRTDAYKYIIFLTDGNGSYSNSYTTTAAEKGIIVFTIGLGSGVDEDVLTDIAEGTGGKYYFASAADALLDVYNDLSFETIDYTTDSNNDGICDYYTRLIADGVLRDGSGRRLFPGAIIGRVLDMFPDCFDVSELVYQSIQASDDFDGDGLLNGEELIITSEDGQVYAKVFSDPMRSNGDADPFDDDIEHKLEGSPLAYDVVGSDLTWLTKDSQYPAALSAKEFVKSGWYRTQLGLGNFIYGGEYNWCYAAKKQLLNCTEDYAENLVDSYKARYKAENFLTLTGNFVSEVNDYLAQVINASTPVSDSHTARKILEDMEELLEKHKELSKMDKSNKAKVDKKCAEMDALYKRIDDTTGELSSVDFSQYKTLHKINLKIPTCFSKAGETLGAVGNTMSVFTASVDYIDAIGSTISGYAALTATSQAYGSMYDLFLDLAGSTEITFVQVAASDLMLAAKNMFIRLASEASLLINDRAASFDEVAVDLILAECGPVGWAIGVGRGLGNLISGIGGTCKQHLYMITAGEAGRIFAKELKRSMKTTDEHFNETSDRSLDYMLICGSLRITGEKKVMDSSAAQSWLFKKLKGHDDVVSQCKYLISMVNNVLDTYGLKAK